MRNLSNRLLWVTAAAILLAGAAGAGSLYMARPRYQGPDPSQLRELASRLREEPLEPSAGDDLFAAPALEPPAAATPAPAREKPKPAPSVAEPTAKPAAPSAPAEKKEAPAPASAAPSAPAAPSQPEDPLRNIALVGVTQEASGAQAFLVDLASGRREVAGVGETAFGFTVREVGSESVRLARGSDEFTLRLGDKQVPTQQASAAGTAIPAAASGPGGPGGPGGFGPPGFFRGEGGGFRGPDGGSSDSRDRMREFFRSRFGSSGGSGGSYTPISSSGDSRSSSGESRYRSSGSSSSSSSSGSGFFPFWAFGGGRRSSTETASDTRPTSNPQTARRRGVQLIGDQEPMPTPEPISNPQTLRRLGTTTGPAFGEASQGSGFQSRTGYGNRTSTGSASRSGTNR